MRPDKIIKMTVKKKIAVIGAGAAGCFCAANIAEMSQLFDITVFESGAEPMRKLALTGGGRCNITNTFEGLPSVASVYPRGANLMKKLFYTFDHNNTVEWFENHGVALFAQPDGRVFPESENAMQVVDTLYDILRRNRVSVKTGFRLQSFAHEGGKFQLFSPEKYHEEFDIMIVATGGAGKEFIAQFVDHGIEIADPVPSLFTFTINDKIFNQLTGVTIEDVSCSLASTKFSAEGSILVTHWGLSGPAVLKLSSYAARYLAENKYTSFVIVNWLNTNEEEARTMLLDLQKRNPQKGIVSAHPTKITNRLWQYFLSKCGIEESRRWAEVSKKSLNRLVSCLISDNYKVQGKGRYRDEFVTCGGVSLSSVYGKTLESKSVQNLYFIGEILDIDAVTGGFNLQAAWTTGYTVATSVVSSQSNQN